MYHLETRWYTWLVPTARPRYQVTDTGSVRAMLDDAAKRWPEVRGRKALLLRLAEAGAAQIAAEKDERETVERRARQVAAIERSRELIDVDVLLSGEAWR